MVQVPQSRPLKVVEMEHSKFLKKADASPLFTMSTSLRSTKLLLYSVCVCWSGTDVG